jgi:hypothetical protein
VKPLAKNKSELICPVCKGSSGGTGEQFASDWAVLCHISGKAVWGDKLHKKWVLSKIPEVDLRDSVISIARQITQVIQNTRIETQVSQNIVELKRQDTPHELIEDLETKLHDYIEIVLKQHFGESEENWWLKGVPRKIRIDCAVKREQASNRQRLYDFSDFIDLHGILEVNWKLFEESFVSISKDFNGNHKLFLNGLA